MTRTSSASGGQGGHCPWGPICPIGIWPEGGPPPPWSGSISPVPVPGIHQQVRHHAIRPPDNTHPAPPSWTPSSSLLPGAVTRGWATSDSEGLPRGMRLRDLPGSAVGFLSEVPAAYLDSMIVSASAIGTSSRPDIRSAVPGFPVSERKTTWRSIMNIGQMTWTHSGSHSLPTGNSRVRRECSCRPRGCTTAPRTDGKSWTGRPACGAAMPAMAAPGSSKRYRSRSRSLTTAPASR